MPSKRQLRADEVVNEQCDAICLLEELSQHATVRSNATLSGKVAQAQDAIRRANAQACILWFKQDHLEDVADLAA